MKLDRVRRTTLNVTMAAAFAAMIFCATYFIKIPVLAGYIHAGDGFVFLAAVMLPAPYAAAASAIGAGLSDVIGGYPLWLPVTVAVRVLAVFCFSRRGGFVTLRNLAALGVSAFVTAGGYFAFEAVFVYGSALGALAGVPFNLLQTLLGAVIFLTAGRLCDRLPAVAAYRANNKNREGETSGK